MHRTRVASPKIFTALIAAVSVAGVTLAAQTAAPSGGSASTVPRAADGHPDISGIWEHNSATPLERPDELADRATLTDDEVAQLKAKAAELFSGDGDAGFGDTIFLAALRNVLGKEKGFKSRDVGTGDYNSFWVVGRWFERRTSLITDPPNGKLPPMTADAKARQAAAAEHRKAHPFDGPEDIAIGERCITGSVPMLGAGYNNYYQIVQAPTHVAVNMEMRHDTRMIPITNRAHLPSSVHLWLGDPVGRWEGDTFVVDLANFRSDSPVGRGGGTERVRLVHAARVEQRRQREAAPDRAVQPRRPRHAEVRGHRRRLSELDQTVDRRPVHEEHQGSDLRVRLPRGERGDVRHAQRHARSGEERSGESCQDHEPFPLADRARLRFAGRRDGESEMPAAAQTGTTKRRRKAKNTVPTPSRRARRCCPTPSAAGVESADPFSQRVWR